MRSAAPPLALACALALAGCKSKEERPAPDERPRKQPAVTPRAPADTVEHTLRFPAPHTHYFEVEGIYPTGGAGELELMMAVWTPGSYLVRDYSRHLEEVRAAAPSGEPLAMEKTEKNRWRVQTGGADRVVVRYRVYGFLASVRNNYVTTDVAVLNGAPTFLVPAGREDLPHDVALSLADGWERCVTGLDPHPEGDAHRYLARDYDELVDSPIACGDPALYEFEAGGAPHVLANFLEGGIWDGERSARDVEALTREVIDFWGGSVPYERYVYLNVLNETGGGLEHLDSTLMMSSKWRSRKEREYVGWLGLVAHEFFHTWNVKRLRPAPLGPFDYEDENYTHSLWVAEGITSYYDDLLLARAGLMDRDRYLERLSGQIRSVETRPGREVQPLSMASFDAWIKYYRQNENSDNTTVSYYRKGAVVAFLLDARIRQATGGARSLDDAMRLAYERFSGERGYTPEELRALFSEVAGEPLDEFFAASVDGTEELIYEPALSWFGLRFRESGEDEAAEEEEEEEPGYLGVRVREQGGKNVIRRVRRGAPGYEAGLSVEDEIVAIGEYRVPPGGLDERLERYRPGAEVSILVARRGRLRRIPVTLGAAPEERWELEIDPGASAAQRDRLETWLGS